VVKTKTRSVASERTLHGLLLSLGLCGLRARNDDVRLLGMPAG
jgi:hypothetical protein